MNGEGGSEDHGDRSSSRVGEDHFSLMFSFLCDGGKYKLSMAAEETFRIYLDPSVDHENLV